MELTKEEIWYLADVAWYIKGYVAAKTEDDKNDFGQKHCDVLTKVINEVDRTEPLKTLQVLLQAVTDAQAALNTAISAVSAFQLTFSVATEPTA